MENQEQTQTQKQLGEATTKWEKLRNIVDNSDAQQKLSLDEIKRSMKDVKALDKDKVFNKFDDAEKIEEEHNRILAALLALTQENDKDKVTNLVQEIYLNMLKEKEEEMEKDLKKKEKELHKVYITPESKFLKDDNKKYTINGEQKNRKEAFEYMKDLISQVGDIKDKKKKEEIIKNFNDDGMKKFISEYTKEVYGLSAAPSVEVKNIEMKGGIVLISIKINPSLSKEDKDKMSKVNKKFKDVIKKREQKEKYSEIKGKAEEKCKLSHQKQPQYLQNNTKSTAIN